MALSRNFGFFDKSEYRNGTPYWFFSGVFSESASGGTAYFQTQTGAMIAAGASMGPNSSLLLSTAALPILSASGIRQTAAMSTGSMSRFATSFTRSTATPIAAGLASFTAIVTRMKAQASAAVMADFSAIGLRTTGLLSTAATRAFSAMLGPNQIVHSSFAATSGVMAGAATRNISLPQIASLPSLAAVTSRLRSIAQSAVLLVTTGATTKQTSLPIAASTAPLGGITARSFGQNVVATLLAMAALPVGGSLYVLSQIATLLSIGAVSTKQTGVLVLSSTSEFGASASRSSAQSMTAGLSSFAAATTRSFAQVVAAAMATLSGLWQEGTHHVLNQLASLMLMGAEAVRGIALTSSAVGASSSGTTQKQTGKDTPAATASFSGASSRSFTQNVLAAMQAFGGFWQEGTHHILVQFATLLGWGASRLQSTSYSQDANISAVAGSDVRGIAITQSAITASLTATGARGATRSQNSITQLFSGATTKATGKSQSAATSGFSASAFRGMMHAIGAALLSFSGTSLIGITHFFVVVANMMAVAGSALRGSARGTKAATSAMSGDSFRSSEKNVSAVTTTPSGQFTDQGTVRTEQATLEVGAGSIQRSKGMDVDAKTLSFSGATQRSVLQTIQALLQGMAGSIVAMVIRAIPGLASGQDYAKFRSSISDKGASGVAGDKPDGNITSSNRSTGNASVSDRLRGQGKIYDI